MLVTNPRKINHEELRVVAAEAKGSIKHLFLHWTGCQYGQVFDDYHINIDEHGEIYLTCRTLHDRKEHTWHRNTGAVGITLCCAYDAVLNYHSIPDYKGCPPTALQIEQMAIVIAILCRELELEISYDTVRTHAEVADQDDYGPAKHPSDMRWDLYRLTDLPDTQNLCPGGVVLRKKAKAYSKMMLAAQLLHLPEDPMLTHLAAA